MLQSLHGSVQVVARELEWRRVSVFLNAQIPVNGSNGNAEI